MLEPLDETKHFLFRFCGAINYVGGNSDKIIDRPFSEVVDTCFRNGIILKMRISTETLRFTFVISKGLMREQLRY